MTPQEAMEIRKKNPHFEDVDNLIYNPLRTAGIEYKLFFRAK